MCIRDRVDPLHVKMQYVKKPTDIRWGYNLGSLGQYTFTNYPYIATAINIGNITSSISSNISSATNGNYPAATFTPPASGGTGAVFDVTVIGATVTNINVVSQGSGYAVNDVITFTQNFGTGTTGTLSIALTELNLFSGSTQGYVDFELHNSERTELILRVLLYAGVVIRDPQIIQVAAQKVQQEEVNEKS